MISIRNLAKRYGANEVLRGVSFDVERGEIIGIIGPSGSGKSTLLRCINFLEEYEGGEVRSRESSSATGTCPAAGGARDTHANLNALRTAIGMVFQNFNLFPHMTALENVIEGPTVVKHIARSDARPTRGCCSTGSASPTRRTRIPVRSPADNSSALRLRARWP